MTDPTRKQPDLRRAAPALLALALQAAAFAFVDAPVAVRPVVASAPVRMDADDPAIWVHPRDPARSLVLGTEKSAAPEGALYVFDLEGKVRQRIGPLDRPNNVDVEHGVALNGEMADLAVVTERYQRRLRAYRIDADSGVLSDISGRLAVFEGQPGERGAPMGVALYRRPRDGALFAVVSRKEGPLRGYLWQYRLTADAQGRLNAAKVRELGTLLSPGEVEAVAVDDAAGYVYYAEENRGIHKWRADPDHPEAARELSVFGREGFAAECEGIAVYGRPDGTGFLVCTDQLPDNSRYYLYRREGEPGRPHDHSRRVMTFTGGADETDGIELTPAPLGPRFPGGLFVAMNSKGRNFLFYRWSDVLEEARKQRSR